ncbi:MAG: DUF4860 domain-containing protein [Firmicutes bacterium]|jgi:hypothetical protein|nr:DUF4860 domain-containing protein [Bacillota bacterium]NBI64436.1 DUF4860 domain-containing protein [Clostridiales bacterium]
MRFQHRHRHVIDLVFPIALFFVFAASALIVIILAANVYGNTTDTLRINDESRTALSYVSEKIRQSDAQGSMEIVDVEQTRCLVMSSEYNGVSYSTYIYEYGGKLKELFIRNDAPISLESGMDITEISSLSINKRPGNLYQFVVVDSQGRERDLTLAERSVP